MTSFSINHFSKHPRPYPSYFPRRQEISRPPLKYASNARISTNPFPAPLKVSIAKVERGAEQALLGPLALSASDVIKDFTGNIRKSLACSSFLFGTENPHALAPLGFTSGFSLLSGTLNVRGGLADIERSEKISDATGLSLAYLKVAKGVMQSAMGALYIPSRVLNVADLVTASKTYAAVAGVFGSAAGNCFNISSLFMIASMTLSLQEQHAFREQLFAILHNPHLTGEQRYQSALGYLKQLATVTPQERAEIAQTISSNQKYRLLNAQQIAEKTARKEGKLLQRKEAYLKRLTSADALSQIRQKGPAEAKNVVVVIDKQSREKVVSSSLTRGMIATSVIISCASLFLGPTGVIVNSVTNLASSFSLMVMDGSSFLKNYKASEPGLYDELWILISTVIAVTSVSAVFFFSGGILPIATASIAGVVWLGINGLCYYRVIQFEQKNLPRMQPCS